MGPGDIPSMSWPRPEVLAVEAFLCTKHLHPVVDVLLLNVSVIFVLKKVFILRFYTMEASLIPI